MSFSRTNDDNDSYVLTSIKASSPKHTTPRGLCVGDDAEKVYELYGVPLSVRNNQWTYGDGYYDLFSVTVTDGVAKKIHLFSVM